MNMCVLYEYKILFQSAMVLVILMPQSKDIVMSTYYIIAVASVHLFDI